MFQLRNIVGKLQPILKTLPKPHQLVNVFLPIVQRRVAGMYQSAVGRLDKSAENITTSFNSITGYNTIEIHKVKVDEKDLKVKMAKKQVLATKLAYEALVQDRLQCQKDLNSLLQVFIRNVISSENMRGQKKILLDLPPCIATM